MSPIIDDNQTETLPLVQQLARQAKGISPETPFATLCELLRVSPYSLLAVIEPPQDNTSFFAGSLQGIVSAKSIADRLLVATPEERTWLRYYGTASDFCVPVLANDCVLPSDTAAFAAALFDRTGRETAPVVQSRTEQFYLGMISRSDLLRDLHRPFMPPQIGGMATPLGVYLTTGSVSGGVGTLALATTGFVTIVLHMTGFAALTGLVLLLRHYVPGFAHLAQLLPRPLAHSLPATLFAITQTAFFLALLRQTPLAGYHAAEHQVVHTIERGEALLPDVVRSMPRVHPRCSTNLVAGLLIFYFVGMALAGLLGAEVSYLIGAMVAFFWWKPFGSFLQQYATTRPASDREIASGIQAAKDLFQAMDSPLPMATDRKRMPLPPKLRRIWQAGFLQIFLGSGIAIAFLLGIAQLYPPVSHFLDTMFGG